MSDPFLLALSPKVRRAVALILNAIELNPVMQCHTAHSVKRTHDETHQCVTLSDVRCHSKADVPVGNVSWPAGASGMREGGDRGGGRGGRERGTSRRRERSSWTLLGTTVTCIHNLRDHRQ